MYEKVSVDLKKPDMSMSFWVPDNSVNVMLNSAKDSRQDSLQSSESE